MPHFMTITGASDDLVEIGGSDITHEFDAMDPDEDGPLFIAVSDGTLLKVIYDSDGIWRIASLAAGSASMSKVEGIADQDTFDVVRLDSDTPFRWVVCGDGKATAK